MPPRKLPVPEVTLTEITPTVAEDWLGHNSHNRPIRNRAVDEYAAAMKRGEWTFNGDAIRFDYDNTLLDGQHRLWAVVESGVTIKTLVIRGLPPDTQQTMDVGRTRNLSDTMRLRGDPSPTSLAAVVACYWRRVNGQIRNPSARPTIGQALDLLDKHPELKEAVREANKLRSVFRVPVSVAGAVYYELSLIDADDLGVMWEKIEHGVNLEKGSPLLLLRRYLEGQATNPHQKASSIVTYAMFIKAWNHWRQGRLLDRLFWRPAGLNAEPFPEPV